MEYASFLDSNKMSWQVQRNFGRIMKRQDDFEK